MMIPMLLLRSLRLFPSLGGDARKEVLRDHFGTVRRSTDPRESLGAVIQWLRDAQDHSASNDGGFARHYSLLHGWSASYPETSGYIVPTLLHWADTMQDSDAEARARRALDWLVSIQFPEGGFQGGMVGQTPRVQVTFNTGQILLGLAEGARRWPEYLEPMRRAANWLRDSLDADGCWRKHPTPFAAAGEKAYETHVAWGLLEAARVDPSQGYLEAGLRNIAWAQTHQIANGWFDQNCLERPDAPLTHTIGYVLRGVVEGHRSTGDGALLDSALLTASALTQRVGPDGYIAGRLDREWQPAIPSACLTGSVQIAWCWLYLARVASRPEFVEPARRAIGYVRNRVALVGPPGRRGGVKGSFPVDGEYGRYQYLNWAAKFYIDAELALAAFHQGEEPGNYPTD